MQTCAILFMLELDLYNCQYHSPAGRSVEVSEHSMPIDTSKGKQGLAFSFSLGVGVEILHFEIRD